MGNVPSSRPKLSTIDLNIKISKLNIDRIKFPVIVVGIRGYYEDTMGVPDKNDRGIYDDAIFISTPNGATAFNANTDPSVTRKGVAVLIPGTYLYKIGMHNMNAPYEALRQFGRVTVLRDGSSTPVTDTADAPFYIDIHRGGYSTTSSLGCQTIPPAQWPSFLSQVKSELKKNNQIVIPYTLIEN